MVISVKAKKKKKSTFLRTWHSVLDKVHYITVLGTWYFNSTEELKYKLFFVSSYFFCSFLQRFSLKRAPEEPWQYGAYCMRAVPVDTGRVTQGLELSCRRAEVMVRIAQINRKEMLSLQVKKIFNCPFHFKNGFGVSPPLFFLHEYFFFFLHIR